MPTRGASRQASDREGVGTFTPSGTGAFPGKIKALTVGSTGAVFRCCTVERVVPAPKPRSRPPKWVLSSDSTRPAKPRVFESATNSVALRPWAIHGPAVLGVLVLTPARYLDSTRWNWRTLKAYPVRSSSLLGWAVTCLGVAGRLQPTFQDLPGESVVARRVRAGVGDK